TDLVESRPEAELNGAKLKSKVERDPLSCFLGMTANVRTTSTVRMTEQQHQITGTVSDSRGSLPGVTITVIGKAAVAITDQNGRYSLAAEPTDSLVYSFVGYKTVTVAINGRTTVDAVLDEDATALQEVIVNAGYYNVKDKERTGSIVAIKAADIEKQPVTNVLGSMQGRMAGV